MAKKQKQAIVSVLHSGNCFTKKSSTGRFEMILNGFIREAIEGNMYRETLYLDSKSMASCIRLLNKSSDS